MDSKASSESIEKLDEGGYIERAGLRGSKFFTFNITDKGMAALPVLNKPDQVGMFPENNNLGYLQMSSIITHLNRRGYVIEKGLFKRKVEITETGKTMVSKYTNGVSL